MVDQLSSMIAISIVLTFLGLLSATVLMKIGHIKHPKSKFSIYLVVALTASSLVFAPLFSIPTSEKQSNTIDDQNMDSDSPPVSLLLSYGDEEVIFESPLENIITGTTQENNDLNLETQSESSLQRAVCVAILYEKFFKNNNKDTFNNFLERYDLQLDETKIQEASVGAILTEIISIQSDMPLTEISSSQITCKFILNSEDSDEGKLPFTSADISNDDTLFFPLYVGLIFLSIIGLLYFIASITIGKKITLRSLHTRPCNDEKILSNINKICDELGIKMPRVYISQGAPNAFVFGYPITLVLSRSLITLLDQKELEMTIRHELSHIKNKDIIIKPALQSIRIIQFFNPFIHLIVRRLINEREAMADLVSFTNKKDKITFMEALIKIEEHMLHSPSRSRSILPLSAPSLWDHTKKQPSLEYRFDRLFDEAHPKKLLSIFIGFLLLITNISLITAAYQISSPAKPVTNQELEGETKVNTESYIYECTFIIGHEDITCQEIVMFKSNIDRGSWIRYQTEILPLAPYLFNDPSLCVFPQPFSDHHHDSF